MPAPAYYAVTVSNRASRDRGTALVWSRPHEAPGDARREVKAALAAGEATVGFVVLGQAGAWKVREVHPRKLGNVIGHYLDVLEAIVREHGECETTGGLRVRAAEGEG